MRVLGLDVGQRRTGVAISDPSGMLARPLTVLHGQALPQVVALVTRLIREEEGLATIVVGLPFRLDGSANEHTARVLAFVADLRAQVSVPIALCGERLTSIEAESLLARREKDWRRRKARLDAVAAAVILQEYLDHENRDQEPGIGNQEPGNRDREPGIGNED
ncbi:MAG: Holliday junction resolvase RuvX [Luteitalea sp.]|nr:Holliday junction resolvase RuvX [Luteitalea sp.]